MTRTCSTCQAWTGELADAIKGTWYTGECRRSPPHVRADSGAAVFPQTDHDDWCFAHIEPAPDVDEMFARREQAV